MMYLHNPSTIGHQQLLQNICEGYAQTLLIYNRSVNPETWTPMEKVWRLHKAYTQLSYEELEAQLEKNPDFELIAEIKTKRDEIREKLLEAEKAVAIKGETIANMYSRCREHYIELWGHD